ncbi:hypothetical protein A3Q35_13315 [Aeribacillus pallidus]|uniref:hypothetical protein n=1 Tax=Aeribacillus pallidus TaxID=33936 RepID=UPI0007B4ABF6|nr:hypothetical protein [Aeribacillus pallidus]KZM54931.1 hypothetical protein A3Q35_13315 [Aeribacillus pallidus]
MGKSLRKIKRGRETIAFPARKNGKVADQVMQAWNKGFAAGAKQQMKQDTEIMMEWLGRLEEIEGIGPKMAWKIREHLLNFLSERMKKNGD